MLYFSEREFGEAPRETEDISINAWKGILGKIWSRAADGSFGAQYPDICNDGTIVCGVNMDMFEVVMRAEIPGLVGVSDQDVGYLKSTLTGLMRSDNQPSTLDILDLVEFCWKSLGKPIKTDYDPFFKHHHLVFDVEAGREQFRNEIEIIFRRNGIAYELTKEGRIERLAPPVFQSAVIESDYDTGDTELDRLLTTAQHKFLNPRPETRHEALEALWDAWERLKTLDGQGNKKAQAKAMLDGAAGVSSPKFRDGLEHEAKELTDLGNSLRIRHSETNQEMLARSEHMDYLFYRLFSLVHLILRSS